LPYRYNKGFTGNLSPFEKGDHRGIDSENYRKTFNPEIIIPSHHLQYRYNKRATESLSPFEKGDYRGIDSARS